VRFPHHERHTVFLEPEGLDSDSIYVNGLSTSLPPDVQDAMVRCVPGLERAAIVQYGYAVEYDVVAPGQVAANLESRVLRGLFFAGQLLGTSGYEEAAALGFLAGVNAVQGLRGKAPFVPAREEAYVGVLVDDVTGRDHREPYRMFTSRAEHRLLLGVDSARERLMDHGRRLGLVSERAFHVEHERWRRRKLARTALEETRLNPDATTRRAVRRAADIELAAPSSWAQILRRQDVDAEKVAAGLRELEGLNADDRRIVIGLLRYDGYLARHERERDRVRRLRHAAIPANLDLAGVPGLSREVAEAMARDRPLTLADAEALPGMTPAALAVIAGALSRRGDRG
jgi:tRNA uridine 5-carboxymethylaminomethyl modification enzyme